MKDERVSSLLSVETVYMKHPSMFQKAYASGTITYGNRTFQVTDEEELFDAPVYCGSTDINLMGLTLHKVLYCILKLLRKYTDDEDQAKAISILWYDGEYDDDNNRLYFDKSYNETVYDPTEYIAPTQVCYARRYGGCALGSVLETIVLQGNFVQLLGLDPNIVHTIGPDNLLEIKPPLRGHDYISLSSNIVFGSVTTMHGERLGDSDFLCVVPTPNNPGDMEYFNNVNIGGKVELSSNTIDTITLEFSDQYGIPLYSLEHFVVTLIIDNYIPAELPKEDHVRLDKIRKATMELTRYELNKKLRN
jgi:hypothetical protein